MKAKRHLFIALFGFGIGIATLSGQNKKEKKELKKEAVTGVLESANYKINVDAALPMGGQYITLSTPYSLEVKNDSLFSYLPYYGRAYNIPYGGGKGLIFNALIENYRMDIHPKGNAAIRFSARSPEDYCNFHIKVFDNGSVTIDVTMQKRQAISFRGEIALDN